MSLRLVAPVAVASGLQSMLDPQHWPYTAICGLAYLAIVSKIDIMGEGRESYKQKSG